MLRKIVATVIAIAAFAAGIMMGATPHDAGTYFCGWAPSPTYCLQYVPDWFEKWGWLVPTLLACAAAILFFWVPIAATARALSKRHELIPLHTAASYLYGELRGTDLGRFTENLGSSEAEILDSIGMQILHNADVYVRRAPSPKWEIFPRSELNNMGVSNGATGIRYWGDHQALYSDPKVSRKNLRRVSKELKQNVNFIRDWAKAPPEGHRETEIKATPQLKCSFGMNDAGCVRHNTTYTEITGIGTSAQQTRQTNCDWYRIRVDAEGGNISNCRARLISIKRGGSDLLVGENPPLPFVHSNGPEWTATVNEGVPEYIDLLGILYDQKIVLAVPQQSRSSSIHWGDMFSLAGEYEIRVMVTAPSVTPFPVDLLLRWNLQPNTATIEIKQNSPLEIIFDASNPNRKFWSIEQIRDEKGKPLGSHWEYRALIKNNSSKTLRNVKVTIEAIGPMPTRPEPSHFDINKQQLIDLHPQGEALAVIRRWFNPPIVAGMACGTDVYGPIKMIASADDIPPATKLFHFDPEQTPMIFE